MIHLFSGTASNTSENNNYLKTVTNKQTYLKMISYISTKMIQYGIYKSSDKETSQKPVNKEMLKVKKFHCLCNEHFN